MQYTVRNRRRLRPATGELVPASMRPAPVAVEVTDADTVVVEPSPRAEGSGLHRRQLVTEINLTVPFQGRVR